MTDLRRVFLFGLDVAFSAATALVQDGGFSKDDGITPERVGALIAGWAAKTMI